MDTGKEYKIELRNLKLADYRELKKAMELTYSEIPEEEWEKKHIESLLEKFPEGQICVVVNDKVVGFALALIIDYEKFGDKHTYAQITGNETFSTHDPNGNVLYGIELFVHPEYRNLRLGRRLYDARKEICENLNLKSIVAGGRIPFYEKHSHELTPKQYIEKVKYKEIIDPILTFQLANDFHVKKIIRGYLPTDTQSKEYATLIEWNNIYYDEHEKIINREKSVVRISLIQWQMRNVKSEQELIDHVEFFVNSVSNYNSDFILFPEFFNAPLMEKYNHLSEPDAIRMLATHTNNIRDTFINFAISYNVNIITGSMPIVENEKLYNISYLCRRDGSWESFKKIHITPNEIFAWGLEGGTELKAIDTDCGKIGILICYDVEFPELSRLYAEQGVQILFVPFLTDTQNGYFRVRHCSQARAIENECYVAIAGSVGNLPRVANMDIQYAQSAVFSPADFSFPITGVVSEATPNTEMTLMVDVNLDLLKELHTSGSVNNLKDRKKDLYQQIENTMIKPKN